MNHALLLVWQEEGSTWEVFPMKTSFLEPSHLSDLDKRGHVKFKHSLVQTGFFVIQSHLNVCNSPSECFSPVFLDYFSNCYPLWLRLTVVYECHVAQIGQHGCFWKAMSPHLNGCWHQLRNFATSSVGNVKFWGNRGPLPFASCKDKECCKRTRVACRGSDCKIGLGESAAPLLLSAPIVAHTGQKALVFWKPPDCLSP